MYFMPTCISFPKIFVNIRLNARCSSCSLLVPLPRNSATTTTVIVLTKEFMTLQQKLQEIGKPLMSYQQDAGVNYSTYTYWCRKQE